MDAGYRGLLPVFQHIHALKTNRSVLYNSCKHPAPALTLFLMTHDIEKRCLLCHPQPLPPNLELGGALSNRMRIAYSMP